MSPEHKKWALAYLGLGLATWGFLQFFIVGEGKPYWQGIGTQGNTGALSGILFNLEVVALWPLALIGTYIAKENAA